MALSDKYKKKKEAIHTERERLAVERAQSSVKRIIESEQFKLSALALPESAKAVDAIIKNTVQTVLDPIAQLVDTLRAKGFRPAEIRKLVHNFYDTYCTRLIGIDGDSSSDKQELTYEEMLKPVADYFMEHQELYNTLDPEQLRGE